MRLVGTILMLCALAAPGSAQEKPCRPQRHGRVPAITKLPYADARARLIAAGWKPVPTRDSAAASSDPAIAYGNGPEFWKRGYVEVESCAGTGLAPCAFLFEDSYGNRLRVTTAGEELSDVRAHARVTGARFVCE